MYTSETILEVRYYETDLMGIVHHSNYIRYFEWGRHVALVELGLPTQEIEKRGIMMPVIRTECNYKKPAKQGDKLRIVTSVKEMPKVKLVIDTSIYNEEDDLVCNGSVTLGFIHSSSRKPTRTPDFITSLFNQFFTNNI
ncbi:MAG: thioesterase family protein [Bacteroidales bacterium]|jgi:acyl-CoA thioester hydrolase|nr:thioesterase family protein [Bacteroidales bacterium]